MTRFSKAPKAPDFNPKAPKPKLDNSIPKLLKNSAANLKEANKPKALKSAEKAKAKSDAKTLAKLPKVKKAKKNMGEGDVYEVKGKAPKVTRMGKGDVYEVKGKTPKPKKVAKRGGGAGENVVDI